MIQDIKQFFDIRYAINIINAGLFQPTARSNMDKPYLIIQTNYLLFTHKSLLMKTNTDLKERNVTYKYTSGALSLN